MSLKTHDESNLSLLRAKCVGKCAAPARSQRTMIGSLSRTPIWASAADGINYNQQISWNIFIHTLKIRHPKCLTWSLISAHCTDRHSWQTLKNMRTFLFSHFSSAWNRKKKASTWVVYIHAIFPPKLLITPLDCGILISKCCKSMFFQFAAPVFLRSRTESAATDITAAALRCVWVFESEHI